MRKQEEFYEDLCKRCYISIHKPTKKQVKNMVLSDELYPCDCCHKEELIVERIGEE